MPDPEIIPYVVPDADALALTDTSPMTAETIRVLLESRDLVFDEPPEASPVSDTDSPVEEQSPLCWHTIPQSRAYRSLFDTILANSDDEDDKPKRQLPAGIYRINPDELTERLRAELVYRLAYPLTGASGVPDEIDDDAWSEFSVVLRDADVLVWLSDGWSRSRWTMSLVNPKCRNTTTVWHDWIVTSLIEQEAFVPSPEFPIAAFNVGDRLMLRAPLRRNILLNDLNLGVAYGNRRYCLGTARSEVREDGMFDVLLDQTNRAHSSLYHPVQLPASLFEATPEGFEDRAQAAATAPATMSEQRAIKRATPALEEWSRMMGVATARAARAYLSVIRGYTDAGGVDVDSLLHFIRSYRNARSPDIMIEESFLSRMDRTLSAPPTEWPSHLDKPGHMVGVELEFVTPTNYERPKMFGVHVGYDSSVSAHTDEFNTDNDSEVRMAFRYGNWGRLEKTCHALANAGCVANRSCGLHVHFDMRGKAFSEVEVFAWRLGAAMPLLKSLVPRHRWDSPHARRYCIPEVSFTNRYVAINGAALERHKTLEVRMFNGSLNADKIRHWIELLHFVMHRTGGGYTTLESFTACPDAPSHLKKWAAQRASLFEPASLELFEVSER